MNAAPDLFAAAVVVSLIIMLFTSLVYGVLVIRMALVAMKQGRK